MSESQLNQLESEMRANVIKRLEFLQGIQQSINEVHRKFAKYERVIERVELRDTVDDKADDKSIDKSDDKADDKDKSGDKSDASSSTIDRKGKKPVSLTHQDDTNNPNIEPSNSSSLDSID